MSALLFLLRSARDGVFLQNAVGFLENIGLFVLLGFQFAPQNEIRLVKIGAALGLYHDQLFLCAFDHSFSSDPVRRISICQAFFAKNSSALKNEKNLNAISSRVIFCRNIFCKIDKFFQN